MAGERSWGFAASPPARRPNGRDHPPPPSQQPAQFRDGDVITRRFLATRWPPMAWCIVAMICGLFLGLGYFVIDQLRNGRRQVPSRFGFSIGDQVHWIHSDTDVRPGEVGQVVGFSHKMVNVQFQKGAFLFYPNELLQVVSSSPAYTRTSALFDCRSGFFNWKAGWSLGKQEWCCDRYGVGCLVATTAEPYNCEVGEPGAWSSSKRQWCCRTSGKGCSTTLASDPFDCHKGYANRRFGWSLNKRSWCCKVTHLGCPSLPTTTLAWTTTSTYNCEIVFMNDVEHWEVERRIFCCQYKKEGCPTTTSVTDMLPTITSVTESGKGPSMTTVSTTTARLADSTAAATQPTQPSSQTTLAPVSPTTMNV